MRTISILTFILFLSLSNLEAQAKKQSFTLKQAAEYALMHNVDIKNSEIEVRDADARVVEAKSIGLPQAEFTMNYTRNLKLPVTVLPDEFGIDPATGMVNPDFNNEVTFGVKNSFTSKIEVTSLLFDGSYLVGLEAARLYTNQARLQLQQKKDKVLADVRDAYIPAIIIEENRKILNKNINNVEKLLNETKEMYKAGFVEQLDIDRLELTRANLSAEVENLNDQADLILNYLKFQMGYPMEDEIELVDDLEKLLTVPSKADLEGPINYSNRQDHVVLESAIVLNGLNVKRYKAGYLPQLLAFGNAGLLRQGNRIKDGAWSTNAMIGVQLNVPIFDGFDKKAKIERTSLQLELVKNRKIQLEQAIDLQVTNARTSYKNAMSRLADREKNLALAEKIYNTSQIKYKEGVGSSLEITQAEQGLFQAQSNYINAKYNVLVAKVNLDKSLGN